MSEQAASNTPEYSTWGRMIARTKPSASPKQIKNYFQRGIKVCDRWRVGENGLSGFECFLNDVGRKPTSEHSIDRFPNNDGNYEPGNVRWATRLEQNRNQRTTLHVEYKGVKYPLQEAVVRFGKASGNRVYRRIVELGWPVDRALETPPEKRGPLGSGTNYRSPPRADRIMS